MTENHLEEIQPVLQVVPRWSKSGLLYPSDRNKLRYSGAIVSKILTLGGISSMYDLGCGTGLYVQEFINQGVDALGVDGNLAARKELKTDGKNVLFENLAYPLSNELQPRDLVMSIEVAEHLPVTAAGTFVDTMTRLSRKWIVLTASDLHGDQHYNPQHPGYWIELITRRNTHSFRPDLAADMRRCFKKLIRKRHGMSWFSKLLMVFEAL